MQLGDARTGKLADNIGGFGRALRRAGVRVDASKIALAQDAARLVGVHDKADLGAAMETVMVSREQDRIVFRELFDAYFRDPEGNVVGLWQTNPGRGSGSASDYEV